MDERSEQERYWDSWQAECALKLQLNYGHSFGTAQWLARYSRDMLEASALKPLPLCLVTGI